MKKWVIYSSLFGMAGFGLLGCGGGGSGLSNAGGSLAEFSTVIFSSAGVNINPGVVPIVNAQTKQIDELNPLQACVGDTNNNGRCDEVGCQTCADVTPGTSCDAGDFREVCCAQVDRCVGTPTEWTITFNFKSTPLFDASGRPLPRPTSPVIIQGYTAIFSYSSGCPPFLPTSDAGTVSAVVPAPSGGESTAQVSITYSTQPFATSVNISNVCMTTTMISFRPPPGFSGVCNVNAVYNWTVMEQYTGKVKTVSVPVSFQIVPLSDDSTCVP
jgi:hypothetical protein